MLLFCDGMDSYAASANILNKWSLQLDAAWSYSATTGVNGGGALNATGLPRLFKAFPRTPVSSGGRFNYAFWFKAATVPSATQDLIQLYNYAWNSTTWQSALYILNTGVFGIYFNGGFNAQVTTINVCDNAWHYIEVSFLQTTTSTAGALRVYIDGNLVSNITTTTGNNAAMWPYQGITLRGLNINVTIDDLVVWDSQTTDGFAYQPLGINYIETIRPNGTGSVTDLTPVGVANNWDAVNDVSLDNDTSYVTAVTGSDLYNYGDMTSSPTTINGIAVNTHIRANNAGTINFATQLKSGATVVSSPISVIAGTAYRNIQNAFATDPSTSTAWTKSAVDAVEAGIQLT